MQGNNNIQIDTNDYNDYLFLYRILMKSYMNTQNYYLT